MTPNEIRQKFLDFFEKKGHKIVPSSSLIPTDSSVLLTTAGMQQFKPYYIDEESPYGNKTVSVQKCVRTSDIEEVGDESHLTFFEMLGNFSFENAYFKKEAIEYGHEFITKEMGLKIDYVTVFQGDSEIEADIESEKAWKEVAPDIEIKKAERKDNFWGPTGNKGPCGPTTEIYVDSLEIWNLVFNEYFCDENKNYKKLDKPGVDTGMGLERLVMVVQKKKNIFETDLFAPIMQLVENNRITADHLRASVFLLADGIIPSNLSRGYILRRLIRRIVAKGFGDLIKSTMEIVIENYKDFYPELEQNKNKIFSELKKEKEIFEKTLERGMKKIYQVGVIKAGSYADLPKRMHGRDIFKLVATDGIPLELIQETAKRLNIELDVDDFNELMKQHRELSRTASQGMFKSGLAGESKQEIKYHTATHLLLAALREVLGGHVIQKGSNITTERLRLDFSHTAKLTDVQKQKIEKLVNEKIKENLPIVCEEMSLDEAKKQGALGVFEHKYGDKVKVYSIGDFSKEICAGPHVKITSELGEFKIKKEEASSAGVRRIKAILV